MIAKDDGSGIPAGRGRWILLATILGSAMAFIDGSAVNVALPVLQTSLGADVSQTQWIVDAYLLVLSSLMLAGGALGDRFGRVCVFALVVWWRVPRFAPTLSNAIDWRGTALITLSLGAITFALIEGPGRGWRNAVVVVAAALGVVAFVVFIVVELREHDPIVPLSLFRSRSFTGANVLTLL